MNHYQNLCAIGLMALAAIMGASCDGKKNTTTRIQRLTVEGDSIVWKEINAHNFERVVKVCDSLEENGQLTPIRAHLYRGDAYFYTGQSDQALESYKKGIAEGSENKNELWYYQEAGRRYIKMLFNRGDYDGVVREAMPLLAVIDSVEAGDPESRLTIHGILGICNMQLKQPELARENFEYAYRGYREWMKTDTTGRPLALALEECDNYAQVCIDNKLYEDAEKWLNRADTLHAAIINSEHARPMATMDIRQAYIIIHHLDIALWKGQTAVADSLLRVYQSLPFSQTDMGRILINDKLVKMGRYTEAADNYTVLDQFMQSYGLELTMDNLPALIQKMEANIGAGRKDTVVYVAKQLVAHFDSAVARQKEMDAARLATLYDTQGKERQIAEQEAELLRTRVIALGIATVLLTVFFTIYALLRRRHIKRLNEKNEELKTLNAQLAVANERAEESSKMKTSFIQQISHEIRTPLNILSGFTQLVTTPGMDLDEQTKSDINRQIKDNTDRITGLVNKMLELSDANSSSVIERNDTLPAIQIAAEAVDACGIATAKHLTFDMQIAPEAETMMVKTNQRAAVRALTLVLDNARKFTDTPEAYHRNKETEGTGKRALLKVEACEGGLQFTVEDNGPGIPEADAERVFDEFVQLNEYYDGTGIGLTVARSLARRLGGDITLDTTYTGGARFVMTLANEG